MHAVSFHGIAIECRKGDITRQPDVDAIVNAANAELHTGGGVAGAIHSAAGPELDDECRAFAPIAPGEAVITGAHRLANRHVIHCLGPVYGIDAPADRLLADCYRNALACAEGAALQSIAFPAISTGAFGYPMDAAAEVAMQTIVAVVPTLQSVRRIIMVLRDEEALALHAAALDAAVADSGAAR